MPLAVSRLSGRARQQTGWTTAGNGLQGGKQAGGL